MKVVYTNMWQTTSPRLLLLRDANIESDDDDADDADNNHNIPQKPWRIVVKKLGSQGNPEMENCDGEHGGEL